MRALGAIVAALGILAGAHQAAAAPFKINRQIWDAFQGYLHAIGSTKPGVYAVAEDGNAGGGWVCPEIRCNDLGRYKQKAKETCEKYTNPGVKCIIFAVRDEIQVEYEIVE